MIDWGNLQELAECLFHKDSIRADILDSIENQLNLPEDEMRFAKLIVKAKQYGLYALVFVGEIDETIEYHIREKVVEDLDNAIIQVFSVKNIPEFSCYLLKKIDGIIFQYDIQTNMFHPLTVVYDIDTNAVLATVKF